MARSAQVRARMDPQVKEDAERILEKLGITPSAAISMFYNQIVHRRGLPFRVALPNETTRRAIEDAREGRDLLEAESLEDLIATLGEEDG